MINDTRTNLINPSSVKENNCSLEGLKFSSLRKYVDNVLSDNSKYDKKLDQIWDVWRNSIREPFLGDDNDDMKKIKEFLLEIMWRNQDRKAKIGGGKSYEFKRDMKFSNKSFIFYLVLWNFSYGNDVNIVDEWETFDHEYSDWDKTCICSQYNCRELYYVRNKLNGCVIRVGNECYKNKLKLGNCEEGILLENISRQKLKLTQLKKALNKANICPIEEPFIKYKEFNDELKNVRANVGGKSFDERKNTIQKIHLKIHNYIDKISEVYDLEEVGKSRKNHGENKKKWKEKELSSVEKDEKENSCLESNSDEMFVDKTLPNVDKKKIPDEELIKKILEEHAKRKRLLVNVSV